MALSDDGTWRCWSCSIVEREEEECVLRHRLCGEVGEGGGERNSGEYLGSNEGKLIVDGMDKANLTLKLFSDY